jgi:hypothetical protein
VSNLLILLILGLISDSSCPLAIHRKLTAWQIIILTDGFLKLFWAVS